MRGAGGCRGTGGGAEECRRDDGQQAQHFGDGEDVLRPAAALDAEDIDERKNDDEGGGPQGEAPGAGRQGPKLIGVASEDERHEGETNAMRARRTP